MRLRRLVPAITCQLAQVCRRSCHASGSIRARLWAAYQPVLLARTYGSLSFSDPLGNTHGFTEQTVTHQSGSFDQQTITQSLSLVSIEQ